jgi:hypothetical protein
MAHSYIKIWNGKILYQCTKCGIVKDATNKNGKGTIYFKNGIELDKSPKCSGR